MFSVKWFRCSQMAHGFLIDAPNPFAGIIKWKCSLFSFALFKFFDYFLFAGCWASCWSDAIFFLYLAYFSVDKVNLLASNINVSRSWAPTWVSVCRAAAAMINKGGETSGTTSTGIQTPFISKCENKSVHLWINHTHSQTHSSLYLAHFPLWVCVWGVFDSILI